MNTRKLLSVLALSAFTVTCLIACGKKQEVGGEKVIQVKMYEGGYGRDWFDAIARKFEQMKRGKGENVTVQLKDSDYTKLAGEDFVSKMETPNDNQFDLFVLDGADVNKVIQESYDILGTDKQALLEPLTPLLNKPAIGFDGKEETKSIGSRLFTGYNEALQYHNDVPSNQDKWDGEIFHMPWADAMTGIVCNVPILEQAGIDIPVTTDQFVAAVKKISTEINGVSGLTYSGKDAPGYCAYIYNTWFAQYSGANAFNNFIKCMPESEDIQHDGWKVYQDPAMEKALEPLMEVCKNDYLISGSNGATYAIAQHNFAQRRAAFMVNGDWMVKEMKDYVGADFQNLKDAQMIAAPILSSMGPEIGLSNDDELAQLVKLIDAKKDNAEIKTAMENKVDDEGIDRIKTARTIHHGEGANHTLMVPSYADAKELSLEFIRFMYSNDSCNLFNEMTFANLPLTYTIDSTRTLTNYQTSIAKLYDYETVNMIAAQAQLNEVRKVAGISLFNNTAWAYPTTFKMFITNPGHTAHEVAEIEAKVAKDQWANWMGFFAW